MNRNGVFLSPQVLAEIGRRLRAGYDVGQPLPDCLADLVRKIDACQSANPTASTVALGGPTSDV